MKPVIALIIFALLFLAVKFLAAPSKPRSVAQESTAFSLDSSYDKAQQQLKEQRQKMSEHQQRLQQERLQSY